MRRKLCLSAHLVKPQPTRKARNHSFTGHTVTEIDGSGGVQYASDVDTTYGGNDFALNDQVCTPGDIVTRIDASGAVQCGPNGQWDTLGPNLYYDQGNVGIGTQSPTGPLDVHSYPLGPETEDQAQLLGHTDYERVELHAQRHGRNDAHRRTVPLPTQSGTLARHAQRLHR